MGLRDFLAKATPSTHKEEIRGAEFIFYPVRVAALVRAQSVVSEVARAVTSFFDPNEGQYMASQVVHVEEEGAQQINTEAVSVEHAHARIKRRDASIVKACNALLGEESVAKVMWLVLDSLREDNLKPEDIMEQFEAADFVKFVRGMLLANSATFGPLVEKAMAKMNELSSVEEPVEESKIPDPK